MKSALLFLIKAIKGNNKLNNKNKVNNSKYFQTRQMMYTKCICKRVAVGPLTASFCCTERGCVLKT